LATVYSLTEQGTFAIEHSLFKTVDQVRIRGHYYSDKPPLYVVWLATVYTIVKTVAGLAFETSPRAVFFILSFMGSGVFCLFLGILFHRQGTKRGWPQPLAFLGGAGVIFSTWIFSFGGTINNHVPAAALLMTAYFVLNEARHEDPRKVRLLLGGTLLGLVLNLDLPTGGLFALCVIAGMVRGMSRQSLIEPLLVAGGFMVFGVGILAALNFAAHGSFLPAYMVDGAYDYPGNIHTNRMAGLHKPDDLAVHLISALVGSRGIFSYMPLLLLALPGVWFVRHQLSRMDGCFLVGTLLTACFYLTQCGDFGGWAYGLRFLIPLVPPLFWMTLRWIHESHSRRLHALAVALGLWGVITSGVGAYQPWPVCDEGAASKSHAIEKGFRNTFLLNLRCLLHESSLTRPLGYRMGAWYLGNKDHDILTLSFLNMNKDRFSRKLLDGPPPK